MKYFHSILATLLLVVAGCAPTEKSPSPKAAAGPVAVKLAQAQSGDITRPVMLPAVVQASQQATLYSKVTGYLKRIDVDKGDEVKSGQVLAEIEVPELVADMARFRAEQEVAELDFQRVGDAQKKAPDLIVRQTVDSARAKFLTARANLERAETLLSFCKITAPFAGVITRRFVDPGAFVPAATAGGAASSAALLTVMDFKTVRIQMAVPEPEVPLIRNGLAVKVTVEELPGRAFTGTISRFSQALDDSTKTMLAEVDLPNPGNELRPGMFAMARVGVETHSKAVLVPVAAVLVEKTGNSVFIIEDDKAKKIPVKTGFNDGTAVEILEGVKPGGLVIIADKVPLNNGQRVLADKAVMMEAK